MFSIQDIHVYIFNWKKVSHNTMLLYDKIKDYVKNVTIVNSDENFMIQNDIKHIQLDDSHYYGSQYQHAIQDVQPNSIFCVIVGDNIVDNDFKNIFDNAINAFNNHKIGIYAPNDKRSPHIVRLENIKDNLYDVVNTDCGFWFIHPTIVSCMKKLNHSISKFGWGIDLITIFETKRQNFLVARDYSVYTDQLDHYCGYDLYLAEYYRFLLETEYIKLFGINC